MVADVVLDLAGIGVGGLLVHAQADEQGFEQRVALEGALGDLSALIGQGQVAVVIYRDKTARAEQADGAADAGFGKAHMLTHVDGADVGAGFREAVDGFQIHLARFLQVHRGSPFGWFVSL